MPQVKCKICNADFYVKLSHQKLGWGKYCSTNCKFKSQKNGKNFKCFFCDKTVYRSKRQIKHSKSGLFFCNKSCRIKWRNSCFIGENHPNWINGRKVYKQVLIRSGKKRVCTICNLNDERVLVVHHLDRNQKNNVISNLIWLCCNCHHLVHYYKNFENKNLKKITR